MPAKPAYYELSRMTVIDHAGTHFDEVFFTASRDRLIEEVRRCFEPRGGFVDDVLEIAWARTVEEDHNRLGDFFPVSLTVWGDAFHQTDLIPDMTITRGERQVVVAVDPAELRARSARRRSKKIRPFSVREKSYASLEALGDAPFIDELRGEEGEAEVTFDLHAMIAGIPELEGELITEPLRFTPFFESQAVRDYWEDECMALPIDGEEIEAWDGVVPLERWIGIETLETVCMDTDTSNAIVPS